MVTLTSTGDGRDRSLAGLGRLGASLDAALQLLPQTCWHMAQEEPPGQDGVPWWLGCNGPETGQHTVARKAPEHPEPSGLSQPV